ncbi:MAG: hypothetical protein LAO20_22105 [Acidobacteriia bacterium]|nr:hypothetical protein [Terriglobia bacterium]
MTATKRKNKSGRSTRNQPQVRSGKTSNLYRPLGSFPFPQVCGKTITDVYVTTDSDLNCLTISFDDNTELVLDVEPCVRFAADYSAWKNGNQRVIKRWPLVRSK